MSQQIKWSQVYVCCHGLGSLEIPIPVNQYKVFVSDHPTVLLMKDFQFPNNFRRMEMIVCSFCSHHLSTHFNNVCDILDGHRTDTPESHIMELFVLETVNVANINSKGIPTCRVSESLRLKYKVDWGSSGGTWWPNTLISDT